MSSNSIEAINISSSNEIDLRFKCLISDKDNFKKELLKILELGLENNLERLNSIEIKIDLKK